jgi:hypothetical protein
MWRRWAPPPAEMEVTEIVILAKIYQQSSHSRGEYIFKFIGPCVLISLAPKTPSYNTNLLPKDFFDETVYVTFKISTLYPVITLEQNIDETNLKHPKIHSKIQTKICEPKVSRLFSNLRDFHTKIYGKSIGWPMDIYSL